MKTTFQHFMTHVVIAIRKCLDEGKEWCGVLCLPDFNVEVEIKRTPKLVIQEEPEPPAIHFDEAPKRRPAPYIPPED